MKPSRFQKYLDKFKPEVKKDPTKTAHLGETLVMDLGDAVVKRLHQILPFFVSQAKRECVNIKCSNTSYWDEPEKYLVMTIFLRFDRDIVWKDEEDVSK